MARERAGAARSVLVLTTSFPRTPDDVAGRFVAEAVADLSMRGHPTSVLAPGRGWTPRDVPRLAYRAPGGLLGGDGAPEALRARPLRAGASGLLASASLQAAALRHAFAHERLVGHWLVPCGVAAVLAARAHGRPAHLYAHGGDVALLERLPGGARVARWLDAHAADLVFVSDDLRRRFDRLVGRPGRARRHVLPMGIAPPRPDPARVAALRALHGASERPVVLTVGRLVPIKGFDVLVRALAGRPDVIWIAAGDGPERARLRRQAVAAGVDLRLVGAVSPAERDALMAVADVFALPSRPLDGRTEGTPTALLEAMAAGRPAVAAATGGVPEVAGPGVRLVPPDDPGALRAAIDAWLADPVAAARAGRANAAHARPFQWPALGAAHARALRLAR